jgi:hypothetical protein
MRLICSRSFFCAVTGPVYVFPAIPYLCFISSSKRFQNRAFSLLIEDLVARPVIYFSLSHTPSLSYFSLLHLADSLRHSITGGFLRNLLTAWTPKPHISIPSHLSISTANEHFQKLLHRGGFPISYSFMERSCNLRLWAFSRELSF